VIFQDFIPYLDSKCDYCIGNGEPPKCITSCPEKAIEVKEVEENIEQDIYLVGDNLAVHSRRWSREDVQPPRKK
jgi:Fe-S-cluster-containing dehydrogenase component